MAISVNVGEAKARFSELLNAALDGQDVVVMKAGEPQIRFLAIAEASEKKRLAVEARRRALYGRHKGKFSEARLTVPGEISDDDLDERFERKFGHPPAA
ncbi:MAG: type II toxin-antitoxin system prevent-host-death family antitoxin [Pacificimonas sp.]